MFCVPAFLAGVGAAKRRVGPGNAYSPSPKATAPVLR